MNTASVLASWLTHEFLIILEDINFAAIISRTRRNISEQHKITVPQVSMLYFQPSLLLQHNEPVYVVIYSIVKDNKSSHFSLSPCVYADVLSGTHIPTHAHPAWSK